MSGKAIDLSGQDFGLLHVLHRAEDSTSSHAKWVCRCRCGNIHTVQGRYLKSGDVQSCGCMGRGQKPGIMSDRELSAPSDSLYRLRTKGIDPYQNLANAIICVAADDYKAALKNSNTKLLDSLTEFFHSDWYKVLTSIRAEDLMRSLHREIDGSLKAVYIS